MRFLPGVAVVVVALQLHASVRGASYACTQDEIHVLSVSPVRLCSGAVVVSLIVFIFAQYLRSALIPGTRPVFLPEGLLWRMLKLMER